MINAGNEAIKLNESEIDYFTTYANFRVFDKINTMCRFVSAMSFKPNLYPLQHAIDFLTVKSAREKSAGVIDNLLLLDFEWLVYIVSWMTAKKTFFHASRFAQFTFIFQERQFHKCIQSSLAPIKSLLCKNVGQDSYPPQLIMPGAGITFSIYLNQLLARAFTI